jgi:hypothetical protein
MKLNNPIICLSLSTCILLTAATALSAQQFLECDNGILRLKLDLIRGGAIAYISQAGSTRNLVNIADEGRYIQQSYYAGNSIDRKASGQHPAWSPWSWNPIQVGDVYRNRAQILNSQKNGNTLYVKCIPKLWDMNNMAAEAEMEQWTTLDGNTLYVRNKLTCHRTDMIYGEGIVNDQELPAVYPISALSTLYSYFGNAPFTNKPMNKPSVVNLSSGFWGRYNTVTENWMAFVDNANWGMGVFNPNCSNFLAGMAGSPGFEASDGSTCYISPIKREAFNKNSIYEYEYYIIIGAINVIRDKVYSLRVAIRNNLQPSGTLKPSAFTAYGTGAFVVMGNQSATWARARDVPVAMYDLRGKPIRGAVKNQSGIVIITTTRR